jgi:hypothetical protein
MMSLNDTCSLNLSLILFYYLKVNITTNMGIIFFCA